MTYQLALGMSALDLLMATLRATVETAKPRLVTWSSSAITKTD
jgi:hypothetical protein